MSDTPLDETLPIHAISKALSEAGELLDEARPGDLVLGRYRLVREVGRGGMGVVHEARDLELQRRVAIKFLALPPGAPAAARERFLREARAAARLDHEHLAAVYEATPDALVMQFVDGAPLSSVPRDDVRRIARLLRDAARAVHHAHEHGVVHRDLKPQNLLVEPTDGDERIVVTDFGLAKDLDAGASLSVSGHVLGTPSYMAPEQAAGESATIDARTDVWGLGATLFDMLTGRPPFVDGDVIRLLRRIAEEDPPAPRSIRRDLPRDLDRIVRMALAPEPARRYASAAAFADDLDRFLTHRPVVAHGSSLGYRTARFVRRHRVVVTAASLALLGLLVAGAVALDERARRQASSAALSLSEATAAVLEDAALARRLGDIERAEDRLDQGIAHCEAFVARYDVPHARFLLGRLLRARGDDDGARRALDEAIAADPALLEARLERGLLLADQEDDAAATALALADLDAALAAEETLRRVDRVHARAVRAWLADDLGAARRAYEEVLRLDPLSSPARLGLSRVALAEGNDDAAWGLAMSAVDLHRGFGPAYLARSAPWSGATNGAAAGAVDRAVRQHELAAAQQQIAAGDTSVDALFLRGEARLRLDDVDGALADFAEAVRRAPSDAMAIANRGLVRARRAAERAADGRLDDALADWAAAVEDWTSALRLEPALAGALNNRGVARLERERLLRARGRLDEAALERARAGEDFAAAVAASPRFALALGNRAAWRRRAAEDRHAVGDEAGARQLLVEARADLDAVLAALPDDEEALAERATIDALAHELDG